MESLPLGHYLTLRKPDNSELRFQNFHIHQDGALIHLDPGITQRHLFLPFGFSGITVARDGGNVESTLVFPNNEIARGFADEAIRDGWVAVVRVCIVQRIDDPTVSPTTLHRYVGQVAAGGWDDTAVKFQVSSVLDAVGSDVPQRTIHQRLVGNLPVTGSIAF
jgi:hypothetical protein